MAIFIVSWHVTRFESAPCPDYKPDKYTGEYPIVHCAVMHARKVEEDKSASFPSREEAEKFVKEVRIQPPSFSFRNATVSDFKITEDK